MSLPETWTYWLTLALFIITYAALALGRVPGLRIDRAGIAFAGAAFMLLAGSISIDDAANSIDFPTIAILLGMMIVVAHLHLAGFFAWITDLIGGKCSGPYSLLAVMIGLSGTLSALLVNDVVCVALTPLTLRLCQRLGRPPVPYLIAVATASNIGSVATITGNPQNIIVGSLSGISYLRFAERLAPIAIVGLVVNFTVIAIVYRRQLAAKPVDDSRDVQPRTVIHRGLMTKTVMVTLATIIGFFAGLPIAIVALGAASVCLLNRIRPTKVYERIDWSMLMMFAGLFIVVRAFEIQIMQGLHVETMVARVNAPIPALSALSAVMANLVSNVPAVLLLAPVIGSMPDQEQAWLTLAMSSTLAGNLTLLGSVANLIVVETARKAGIEIGFVEYLKGGVVLTIVTILLGVAWLMLTHIK